ncbi:MAG: C-terminal binding protein [Planctomycetota bacterium]|jgi:D-3-phosphoglycerate dehydrogenase|nr:C-terminal binding protein [Planctomycetota bacterium]
MGAFRTVFTDCDLDLSALERVFRENGVEYRLLACKTPAEVIREAGGLEIIMNQYVPLGEEVFAGLPELKAVVRHGVGVNHIDLAAAARHGVKICNVPDGSTHEVADHAMALLLALARKIVPLDRKVRDGRWTYLDAAPLFRLSACTAGVIGLGRIGSAFAARARAFGMRILAFDEIVRARGGAPDYVELTDLDAILRESDFISVHCPQEGNLNLIGTGEMARMKKTACIINVSRGGIVNEDDLAAALREGRLGGAALDVFLREPVSPASPLLGLDNFICTPHIAFYTETSLADLAVKVAEEVVRYFKGQPLRCPVN